MHAIRVLIDCSLTVKATTLIFISGRASAISSAKQGKSEASSTTRVLSSAHCTDARLNTLRIKIGTRTTSAREHSCC